MHRLGGTSDRRPSITHLGGERYRRRPGKLEYDKNGNRTKLVQNGDTYIYQYGDRNRLEAVSVKKKDSTSVKPYLKYTYDANGNTIERIAYTDKGEVKTAFEYDTLNRVVKTTAGGKVTEYLYDNAGNRFVKKGPEGTTLYLRHGQIAVAMDVELPVTVTDVKGKVNRYVLSGDLLAGRITKEVKSDGTSTVSVNYYHLDHLNSTKCVSDDAGVVEVRYVYRAFGSQLAKIGSGEAKYTYGGKELDEENGLYYFNARYYDAEIGRFISVDPAKDGLNWYSYCNNNPLKFVDPTGLKLEQVTVGKQSIYVDEHIATKFREFISMCNNAEISVTINTHFRDKAYQEHLHHVKYSNDPEDIIDRDEKHHNLTRGVNPSGKSYHEVGLAVDINVNGLTEEQQDILQCYANTCGFFQVVSNEPWHFGYIGNTYGVPTSEKNLDREKIATDLGYSNWKSMYEENQKDYLDKGNSPYKCPFGNND